MPNDVPDQSRYDAATRNHDRIRRWVTERGGRPVATDSDSDGGTPGIGFQFPEMDEDGGDTSMEWDTFFERFEEEELTFAYAGDTNDLDSSEACRLVPRDRLGDLEEDESEQMTEEQQDARERAHEEAVERETEQRSEVRERGAEEQENIDNHRDEPPFQS